MITHPATLDVSRELAQQVSRLLHAERRRRGTRKRSRALSCFRHAVLGLRWFRHGTDITALARDHGVSRATGYRYIEEVVTVLAAQAPDLHEALEHAKAQGMTAACCGTHPRVITYSSPSVMVTGLAYVADHGGTVHVLDTTSGTERRTYRVTKTQIWSSTVTDKVTSRN